MCSQIQALQRTESVSFLDDEDDEAGSDGEPVPIMDVENPAFEAALWGYKQFVSRSWAGKYDQGSEA
ncbi:MAG: hypothetical protein ABI036_07590 [Fibrobacteria bacterium]